MVAPPFTDDVCTKCSSGMLVGLAAFWPWNGVESSAMERSNLAFKSAVAKLIIGLAVVLLAATCLLLGTANTAVANTSIPHAVATCTQAAAFPYGSAIVGMAATSDDGGYWIVNNEGYVAACGDAAYLGEQTSLNAPIVGIAATPDGGGYYLVASDGGVFTFGDARFQGSTGSLTLNKPVVGMEVDPATGGYWLVATDGGIFAYGAPFLGSTGSIRLNQPVVGMATAADRSGYWVVASDGGLFAYGVPFWGSTGSIHLNKPVVGMAADAGTGGYWLVASDGGIFAFNARFYGSTGSIVLNKPIVAMESDATGSGYRFVAADGGVFPYGTSGFYATPLFAPPPAPPPGGSPSCTVSLSNDNPPQYSSVIATITSNVPNTALTLTKTYQKTTSSHFGTTDSSGTATISFNISAPLAGVAVVVTVYVGAATCRTSFTPT